MSDAICESCPWWERDEDEPYYWKEGDIVKSELRPSRTGDCRRCPPRPYYNKKTEQLGCTFPVTGADLWCGEHPQRTKP